MTKLLKQLIEITKKLIYLKQTLLIQELKRRRKDKTAMRILIEVIAQQEKTDPDLAVRVALCESNFNPDAKNQNPNGTLDRGLFQWNDYYHPEITDRCAFDPECSAEGAGDPVVFAL